MGNSDSAAQIRSHEDTLADLNKQKQDKRTVNAILSKAFGYGSPSSSLDSAVNRHSIIIERSPLSDYADQWPANTVKLMNKFAGLPHLHCLNPAPWQLPRQRLDSCTYQSETGGGVKIIEATATDFQSKRKHEPGMKERQVDGRGNVEFHPSGKTCKWFFDMCNREYLHDTSLQRHFHECHVPVTQKGVLKLRTVSEQSTLFSCLIVKCAYTSPHFAERRGHLIAVHACIPKARTGTGLEMSEGAVGNTRNKLRRKSAGTPKGHSRG
ncbi:unnamed protein product [Allacma fusca]|uniref:Uncharacterized protein n=1 Tax=Allacma fusca TaxID=39272 RepID=A0A8J2JTR5_9HEXA|nr:unnamed protein product [Allacma fusca]